MRVLVKTLSHTHAHAHAQGRITSRVVIITRKGESSSGGPQAVIGNSFTWTGQSSYGSRTLASRGGIASREGRLIPSILACCCSWLGTNDNTFPTLILCICYEFQRVKWDGGIVIARLKWIQCCQTMWFGNIGRHPTPVDGNIPRRYLSYSLNYSIVRIQKKKCL